MRPSQGPVRPRAHEGTSAPPGTQTAASRKNEAAVWDLSIPGGAIPGRDSGGRAHGGAVRTGCGWDTGEVGWGAWVR